jgi:hypothetical protein
VGCGGLEPLTPRKAVARRSEVGRGPSVSASRASGDRSRPSDGIANLYSQTGAVAGGARRREAENRIRQEAWGGVMRRSGRTFKPMVQGSNPCAGTKSEFRAVWARRVSACRDSSTGWRWRRFSRRQRPRPRRFRNRSTGCRCRPSRSTCMTIRLARLVRFPQQVVTPTVGAPWTPCSALWTCGND